MLRATNFILSSLSLLLTVSTRSAHGQATDLLSTDWLTTGNGVSIDPSTNIVTLQSSTSHANDFGVLLTKNAYNGDDLDFAVDYITTDYSSLQTGYESQLVLFLTEAGTATPEDLYIIENNFADFEAKTVGYLNPKVHTNLDGTLDYTWFFGGTPSVSQGWWSTPGKKLELSVRIRRLDNQIYSYYKALDSDTWLDIPNFPPMPIPEALQDVPLQFGMRVRKEYKAYHKFDVQARILSSNPPLPVSIECLYVPSAERLRAAFQSSTDGIINVCASETPILWDETYTLDSIGRIYLTDANYPNNPYKLTCLRSVDDADDDTKRCVIDFAPTDANLDPSTQYGGFAIQDQNDLTVDGFDFINYKAKGSIFNTREESTLTIKNCVFTK